MAHLPLRSDLAIGASSEVAPLAADSGYSHPNSGESISRVCLCNRNSSNSSRIFLRKNHLLRFSRVHTSRDTMNFRNSSLPTRSLQWSELGLTLTGVLLLYSMTWRRYPSQLPIAIIGREILTWSTSIPKSPSSHYRTWNQSNCTLALQERLAALEECRDLGQGFQLAERDMAIRGSGNIFGLLVCSQQDEVFILVLFLVYCTLQVDEHRIVSVPYQSVQFNMNLNPHLPSEYINYLENPLETINEAENAAERDIWNLIQFTENLRRHYGKESYSMEILLKKLYIRRMAADLGITKIYTSGKMVVMKTNTCKKVFKLMIDSMASEIHRTSLVFEDGLIKAELLLELPREQLLNWIFQCIAELYASLPAFIKY
ncbi:UNVERIFIED_CONTAM: ATP-dependent DNA helicase, chloroplastic [Sesamum calycinum]|uniref:ATP-dependent DNA helicase, chloroplastic n=1 Tax=Sesamum calycinum TaxID=2727403 RepID=A0AAW2MLV7_9LAMI